MMMAELDARSVAADVSSGGGESSCEAFQHLISVAQGEARADGMPSPTIHLQDDHRPRQYQTELFERAKKENVIACLDTGAGKTLIAVMLLQHTFNLGLRSSKRISLFIVNLVPLVHQQGGVIEANTCLRVGLLFGGDSRFSTWSKEHYDKAFAEHDVLVVTGQIVVQALAHSFLKIEDLNLIVFDEAHHADATHPYSRIMKDYYFKTPSHKRPKIFGMTASPMKTATNHYQSAARELEGTLDAKIFTAPLSQNDKNELKQVRELVIEYDQPTQLPETDLTEKIKKRCASLESLPKYMHRMRYDLEHHGPLMLDLAWIGSRDAFRNKAREKFERTQLSRPQIDLLNKSWAEKQQFDRESRAMLEELDKKKKRWADEAFWHKAVAELLDEEMNVPRSLEANETNATPKVLTLINLLKCFDVDSKTRQNFCAFLEFLKVEALYGHDEVDGRNGMDSDAQQATLSRFRKGKTNLLVATSVAEEGLDILPCNCVIRFDLFAHHVAYVQSRGRARHKDSRFIMMVQRDDPVMHGILHKVARVDADIRKWLLDLPHDRLSQAFDDDSGDDSRGEKQEALSDYLEVAETGARIYPPESVFFLCHYVQIIKSDVYAPNVPDFIIREYDEGLGFSVEVRLPANSRVRYVQGPICPSKKMARNAASLLALKKLREAGELDDYLIPSARNKTKALRADLPFELDKDGRRMGTQARSHELHAKIPDAFAPGTPTEPIGGLELQGVVLRPPSTTEEAGEAAPYRPMLLLTVGAFKGMPAVDLMFAGGISRQFPVSEDTVLVRLDHREALAATRYTLRLFDYIGKKSYENDGRLPFLVLPLHQPIASRNFVDWMEVTQEAQITTLHDRGVFSYRFDPQDKLSPLMDEDLLLCDWKNPSRLYNFIDLDLEHDLRHIAPDRRSLRDIAPDEPGMCSQPTEPLIVTRVIPSLDNHLVTNAYKALGKRSARWTSYLIPSRAGAFPLSASTAETALLLPSILCRYSQILLSREANALLFHNQLDEGLLMHAFTAPSAQQLLNYEKLEFFGDMALKLIASLYAFTMTDSLREVELHYTRRAIISNAQLLKHSLRHQLHRFVHAKAFSGKTWRPLYLRAPNWSQEEARPSYRKRNTHIVSSEASHPASGCEEMLLSEKSLADLVEACLGAAFNKGGVNGIEAALFAMNKLGVLPREVEGLEAFRRAYALQTARESEGQNLAERVESGALQKLQEHIEYQFRSPHLALQAVTHSSYMAADLPSYERFEFLGDALLDYFIVSTFREKYSDTLDESAMTMIKSNAVANDAFGVLCIELGLHHYFSHSSSSMLSGIMQTVSDVMDARRRALDLYGGDEANIGQYWLKFGVRVPKVLADVIESLLGAVFVDSGFNFDTTQEFFDRLYRPFFERHFEPDKTVVRDLNELTSFFTKHRCRRWSVDYETMDHLKDRRGSNTIRFWISFHGVKVSEGVASGRASDQLIEGLEEIKEVKASEEWNDTGLVTEVLRKVLPKQFSNRLNSPTPGHEPEDDEGAETGSQEPPERPNLTISDELEGICDCAQREAEDDDDDQKGEEKSWWD